MPSYEEARNIILQHARPLGAEVVSAREAVGRVLAADVTAPWDFPAFDNSAMDGYAVRAADATGPVALPLSAYVPAGAPGAAPLAPGTAAKILTGGPLPAGADAVVPVEEAEERGGAVHLARPVTPGAHVRRRGEDLRRGEVGIAAGTVLGPADASFLASAARLSVPVVRAPRVAILSTGDELVPPGEPLGPGKIHDSNALAVAAAVRQVGAVPTLLGIARDEPAALQALLAEGLLADVLVTTAGVSMGDRDHVREGLRALGARQAFWQLDIKPGRPTAFATRGATLVFSLPGNPVSTLLTFDQFVRPALLRMMGHRSVLRRRHAARLREGLRLKPGRVSFVRVRLEREGGELWAASAGNQETGVLKTMLRADGIAVIPAEQGDLPPGARVDVEILRAALELEAEG